MWVVVKTAKHDVLFSDVGGHFVTSLILHFSLIVRLCCCFCCRLQLCLCVFCIPNFISFLSFPRQYRYRHICVYLFSFPVALGVCSVACHLFRLFFKHEFSLFVHVAVLSFVLIWESFDLFDNLLTTMQHRSITFGLSLSCSYSMSRQKNDLSQSCPKTTTDP